MRAISDNVSMLNLKVGRLGELSNAIKINSLCQRDSISTYVGAKYESSIGRWHNIALASLASFKYPSNIAASERYFLEDIVDNPIISKDGCVYPSNEIGGGARIDYEKLSYYTTESIQCKI
ncbi:enolase C-terminal domain-like protein [Marinomonas sp. 2405UD68-3]|uniref:enolase C-terminal domain-like protein n=1 Tax=Marinomonas sp. 2405UD68-3 TaxID=3391835 RepID=UPI0039C9C053